MEYRFYDDWGLISANPDGSYGENNLLYSVEHFILTKSDQDKQTIIKAIEECRISSGLFEQHPRSLLTGNDIYMCRAQLIAIFSFCMLTGLTYHKEIWAEIKRQWFRYNNVNPPKTMLEKITNTSFMQLGDIIYFGICAGSNWWKLLYPFLIIKQLSTLLIKWQTRPALYTRIYYTLKKIQYNKIKLIGTSGKMLVFVQSHNDNKLYNWIIRKRFGSWNNVIKIFFPYNKHPNVIDSKDI
jgi:nitrate reductase NapAB chaperone NapD